MSTYKSTVLYANNENTNIEKVIETFDNNTTTNTNTKLTEIQKMMEGKKTVGEINCQYMDFEKVNAFFGWKPNHSFEEGLSKTIEWFKTYLEKQSVSKGSKS